MNNHTVREFGSLEEGLVERVSAFLYHEARLLDHQELAGWLELLSEDIVYSIPVRTTREATNERGFSTTSFFLDDDYPSMKTRVMRLQSDSAWSEHPATRTRRMVGNIQILSANPDAVECASNLAVYCYRGDASTPIVVTAERLDRLTRKEERWKLSRRMVLLDSTVLGLESLSIFL